jgi:hypothetical protein
VRKRSPWLLVLVAACLIPAALLAQDVIYKTDGGRLRGKILSEASRKVKIKTLGGTYVVAPGHRHPRERGS